MSHKDKHHAHPSKKQIIQARNKRNQIINQHAAQHDAELERARNEEDAVRDAVLKQSTDSNGEVVWSAKLQEIKNRNTNKKRMAMERWNRFAGTSGGGGRGL